MQKLKPTSKNGLSEKSYKSSNSDPRGLYWCL